MRTPARTPEDIIGIIPHTLGYTPQESLVAVIVGEEPDGAQTCSTTLRIDFTLDTAAHILAEGGRWYVDLITRACEVTGVFLILYDEDYLSAAFGGEGVEDEYAGVHHGLVRASIDELAEAFRRQGIATLSAFWVCRDRFGRIDEDPEHSTALIRATTSTCATELIAQGSSPVEAPADLIVRPISTEAFARSREGVTQTWMEPAEAFDILSDVYSRLEQLRFSDQLLDEALAGLLDLPLVMAIDALLRQKWSRDALEMILSFDHPNFMPEDVRGCASGQLHARAQRFSRSPAAAQEIVGLSTRTPRPRDVLVAIAVLKAYVPQGHPQVRATAYAVIAWFEWALGGSTMAEAFARAGLELEPDNGMAGLIVDAVENGFLPRWLMEPQRSPF